MFRDKSLLLGLWLCLLSACSPKGDAVVESGSTVTPPLVAGEPASPSVSPPVTSVVETLTLPGTQSAPPAVKAAQIDSVATGIFQAPVYSMAVRTIEFSPDEKFLASGSGEGEIVIWELGTPSKVAHRWTAHDHWIFDIAFDRQGERLLTASGDNKVKIWQVGTWELLATYEDHDDDVHGLALTQDGNTLVTVGDDCQVIVRDLKSNSIRKLEGHTAQVTSVLLTPDDKRIVSSSRDQTVRIWDLASGKELAALQGHREDVLQVALNGAGDQLVSASYDGTVRSWSLSAYSLIQTIEVCPEWVLTATTISNPELILSGARDMNIYAHTVTGLPQFRHNLGSFVSDLKVAPHANLLAASTAHAGIHLLEVQQQQFVSKEELRLNLPSTTAYVPVTALEYLNMHDALLTKSDQPDWSEQVGKLSLSGDAFSYHLLQTLDISALPAPKREMANRLRDKLMSAPATWLTSPAYMAPTVERLAVAQLIEHPVTSQLKNWLREQTTALRGVEFAEKTANREQYLQQVEQVLATYQPAEVPEKELTAAAIRDQMRTLFTELATASEPAAESN